jgi:RNA 3'-terminal phosphate cyclase (ATP)
MEPSLLDGSFGEGGGQILRTSLCMSLVSGKPFRIVKIRAGRKKPGLQHQHLAAVNAAARVGRADVEGNSIGSSEIYFEPQGITAGKYHFSTGTAGSATLIFETLFPALISADGESELILEGGTHNPLAPPFDFIDKTILPLLRRMGIRITARLERCGFFPAGGGKISFAIEPAGEILPLELLERGKALGISGRALISKLPSQIAERELAVVAHTLSLGAESLKLEKITSSPGPGNAVIIEAQYENITEVFTAFGERGLPAEQVAEKAAIEAQEYLASDVPVGKHLADQLLVPLCLTRGGKFRTSAPTRHFTTNVEVIRRFLDIEIAVKEYEKDKCEVEVMD